MNQQALNQAGSIFIEGQSFEVALEMKKLLRRDTEKQPTYIQGELLRHIQSIALFESLVWLNSKSSLGQQMPKKELCQYYQFTRTMLPKFEDIIDALKDFEATK